MDSIPHYFEFIQKVYDGKVIVDVKVINVPMLLYLGVE